jgi:hypothetical protein
MLLQRFQLRISTEEIVIIKKAETDLTDLEQVIGLLGNKKVDIIDIEGFRSLMKKRPDVLKIVTTKDADILKTTLEEIAYNHGCRRDWASKT